MHKIDQLDAQLFLLLNNLGSEKWDLLWLSITNKWYSIPIYVMLLVFVFKCYGLKKTGVILVFVAALIASTDQFANFFKYGFERPRPCQVDVLIAQGRFIAERCGRYGFFSAHAASSAALAIFMGSLLRKFTRYAFPLLLFWAALVSYSRIYVGVHYPGDVLTGLVIGALFGLLFHRIFAFINIRFFTKKGPKTA